MRRTSIATGLALLTLPLMGVGCVQQDRYDSLLETNRSLKEQLVASQDERDSSRANLDAVRHELADARTNVNRLQQQNNQLRTEMERMGASYDELMGQVSTLKVGPLPRDVESALTTLARNHPEMLTFDARTGMVRFASDFTFDLGSATVRSDAAATLASLADILNSSTAAQFEVRIVGHTDNVPIGRPETRAQHPTNMHLSVHRAISVRDQLARAGLNPARMQVAGYGPYRPIVANSSRGAAQNRRVELFLAPLGEDVPLDTMATETPRAKDTSEPTRSAGVDPMK